MKYAKITEGIVEQVQPYPDTGFAEVPDYVVCGMVDNGDGTYSNPEKTLDELKAEKITELRNACRTHIFAGFDSDALGGVVHHYPAKQDSTHQDQLNLNGLVTKSYEEPTNTFNFWCADANGVWGRRAHTAEQIRKAGVDGAEHVIAAQDKLAGLIAQVEDPATDTQAKLDEIQW